MRKEKFILLFMIASLLGFNSCTETSIVPVSAGPPVIQYLDIQPREITEFQDSIVVRFSYQDPNGDIGYDDPNIFSLAIQDLRLDNPDWYHVQMLAPEGEELDISGELELTIKNSFLLGTGSTETTSYELILVDRAGNKSNPIQTDPIKINR